MDWEKGPDAKSERQMSRSIMCLQVVFSILYSFPRACLCPKTGGPIDCATM
jgi:hypothetical protein